MVDLVRSIAIGTNKQWPIVESLSPRPDYTTQASIGATSLAVTHMPAILDLICMHASRKAAGEG